MSVRLLASQVGVCTIASETVQERSSAILLLTITLIKITVSWHVTRQTGTKAPPTYCYATSYCNMSERHECSSEMLLFNTASVTCQTIDPGCLAV
jgi:hypothetical protein